MATIDEIIKARLQGKPIVPQTSATLPSQNRPVTQDSQSKPSIDEIVKRHISTPASAASPRVQQAVEDLTPPSASQVPTIPQVNQPTVLSGQTYLTQAPEKKWPLGFVGQAAKAAYTTAKDTIEGAAGKIDDFFSSLTAKDKLDTGLKAITDQSGNVDYSKETGLTIGMTPEQRKAFYDDLKEQSKGLNKAVKGGQAALGVANIAFLPVTSQLEAAKKVPLLKYPAEAASFVFQKLGEAGGFVMDKAVDLAPIDDNAKKQIRPLANELGGFIAQLVGVKYGFKLAETGGGKAVESLPITEGAKEIVKKGVQHTVGLSMTPFTHAYGVASGLLTQKLAERQQAGVKITPEEGQKIIEEVKQELPAEIQKEQEKNPTPSPVDLEMLAKSSATESTHSMREVMTNLEELGYSPKQVTDVMASIHKKNPNIKRYTQDIVANEIADIKPERTPKRKSTAVIVERENAIKRQRTLLKEREATAKKAAEIPEVKVTEEATPKTEAVKVTTEETSAAKVITETKAPEVPETPEAKDRGKKVSSVYERLKKEHPEILTEDASREAIKLKEDAQKAVDLLEKNRDEAYRVALGHESRSDVTNTAVNIAMAEQALREKNYELYNQLVKSRSFQQTRRGQEIVAEKGSVADNSTARYFKDLLNIRLEKLGDSYLSNLKETFKKGSKKQRAIDVIDSEVQKAEKTIRSKKLKVKDALILLDKLTCV